MPITDLSFVQFETVEPGDIVTVWRGDFCVGSITAERNGNFIWRFAPSYHWNEKGEVSDYAQAQTIMAESFREWCAACCLAIDGENPPPGAPPDYAAMIERYVFEHKTSAEARSYMNARLTQRMLREIDPEPRGALSRKIRAHIAQLVARESADASEDENQAADG
jgi:hypothetical protein